jgi:hypothetical protein
MKHGHNNWHLGEVKYGVHVPNNVHEAFALNQENGNTYWANAIALEMNALKKMGCFKIPPPNGILKLRVSSMPPPWIVFDVKSSLKRKAHLVCGSHVI